MSRFVHGVEGYLDKDCRTAMLHQDMDFPRMVLYAQQIKAVHTREREAKRARTDSHRFSQSRSGGGHRQQTH